MQHDKKLKKAIPITRWQLLKLILQQVGRMSLSGRTFNHFLSILFRIEKCVVRILLESRSDKRMTVSGQALCGPCRDETHASKMFRQHDVIHMSKKAKELHRKVIILFDKISSFGDQSLITNISSVNFTTSLSQCSAQPRRQCSVWSVSGEEISPFN